jgi:hypothetical protein
MQSLRELTETPPQLTNIASRFADRPNRRSDSEFLSWLAKLGQGRSEDVNSAGCCGGGKLLGPFACWLNCGRRAGYRPAVQRGAHRRLKLVANDHGESTGGRLRDDL